MAFIFASFFFYLFPAYFSSNRFFPMWNALALTRQYLCCLQIMTSNKGCYTITARLDPQLLFCFHRTKFFIVPAQGSLFFKTNTKKLNPKTLYLEYGFALVKLLKKEMVRQKVQLKAKLNICHLSCLKNVGCSCNIQARIWI